MRKSLTVSFTILLALSLVGCTVTTKSEALTLSERAYSEITAGCDLFNKGDLEKASLNFANAARFNPEFVPVLEKFNLIINNFIPNPNSLELDEFMLLFCSTD